MYKLVIIFCMLLFMGCGEDSPTSPVVEELFINVTRPSAGSRFLISNSTRIQLEWTTNVSGTFDIWVERIDASKTFKRKILIGVPDSPVVWLDPDLSPGTYIFRVQSQILVAGKRTAGFSGAWTVE